jgi:pimeloyl-ACP methyl ester carboxylesterase
VLRPRKVVPVAILLLPVVLLAGCGGGERPRDPLSDDSSQPLDVRVSEVRAVGTVEAERLDFAAADGQRVPALFARPLGGPEAGCLIYEGGLGSGKEKAIPLWRPAAKLGLSTFSLDMRLHGERAESGKQLEEATGDAAAIERLVTGTVVDLRRAIDYLSSLPECRDRIAYAGLSFGGTIGSILAGRDRRVKAAVIMSVPPTWRDMVRIMSWLVPDLMRDPEGIERRLSPYDPVKWIPRIAPRPVMLLHGDNDRIVPIEQGRQTQAAAREPSVKLVYAGGHDPAAPPAGRQNGVSVSRFLRAWLHGDAGALARRQ